MKASKSTVVIAAIALTGFAVALLLWPQTAPTAITQGQFNQGLEDIEKQVPLVIHSVGSEDSDKVALPLLVRVRQELTRSPEPKLVTGFPETVDHYIGELEPGGGRVDFLVCYTRGRVARIVVRCPRTAHSQATQLVDALRRISGGVIVDLNETSGG